MLQLLETGQVLYVLAGICVLGLLARMMTRNLYKRLVKESANLATAKNKSLKELKQRAENTYRMNQGLRDSSVWVEHQLSELRFRGMTLAGWSNFSMQLTWLCLLLGGTAAFFSYWYRLDTYYIVMYGGGAVLMAMLTMLFDHGVSGGWREHLVTALQDYLENVMCPRLARNLPEDNMRGENVEPARTARGGRLAGWRRSEERTEFSGRGEGIRSEMGVRSETGARSEMGVRAGYADDGESERGTASFRGGAAERGALGERSGTMTAGAAGVTASASAGGSSSRQRRRDAAAASKAERGGQETGQDVDYLKRSLEQIAASREKGRSSGDNWLKDLGPEEVQVIGDILKQYLA